MHAWRHYLAVIAIALIALSIGCRGPQARQSKSDSSTIQLTKESPSASNIAAPPQRLASSKSTTGLSPTTSSSKVATSGPITHPGQTLTNQGQEKPSKNRYHDGKTQPAKTRLDPKSSLLRQASNVGDKKDGRKLSGAERLAAEIAKSKRQHQQEQIALAQKRMGAGSRTAAVDKLLAANRSASKSTNRSTTGKSNRSKSMSVKTPSIKVASKSVVASKPKSQVISSARNSKILDQKPATVSRIATSTSSKSNDKIVRQVAANSTKDAAQLKPKSGKPKSFKDLPPDVRQRVLRRLVENLSRSAKRTEQPRSITNAIGSARSNLPQLPPFSIESPSVFPKRIAQKNGGLEDVKIAKLDLADSTNSTPSTTATPDRKTVDYNAVAATTPKNVSDGPTVVTPDPVPAKNATDVVNTDIESLSKSVVVKSSDSKSDSMFDSNSMSLPTSKVVVSGETDSNKTVPPTTSPASRGMSPELAGELKGGLAKPTIEPENRRPQPPENAKVAIDFPVESIDLPEMPRFADVRPKASELAKAIEVPKPSSTPPMNASSTIPSTTIAPTRSVASDSTSKHFDLPTGITSRSETKVDSGLARAIPSPAPPHTPSFDLPSNEPVNPKSKGLTFPSPEESARTIAALTMPGKGILLPESQENKQPNKESKNTLKGQQAAASTPPATSQAGRRTQLARSQYQRESQRESNLDLRSIAKEFDRIPHSIQRDQFRVSSIGLPTHKTSKPLTAKSVSNSDSAAQRSVESGVTANLDQPLAPLAVQNPDAPSPPQFVAETKSEMVPVTKLAQALSEPLAEATRKGTEFVLPIAPSSPGGSNQRVENTLVLPGVSAEMASQTQESSESESDHQVVSAIAVPKSTVRQVSASGLDGLSDQALYEALLARLTDNQTIESEAERNRRMIMAKHLMVLAGNPQVDVDQIQGLTVTEKEFLRKQLAGLRLMIDPNGHPASGRRLTEALPKLREATQHLAEAADKLEVREIEFCTEIESFGQVTPFSDRKFSSGQQVILYCEIENFTSLQVPDGFQTHLKGTYEVFDSTGQKVVSQILPADRQVSRRVLRDYFIAYQMNLPRKLKRGEYRMVLTIEDVEAEKYGQAEIEFQIR